MPLNQMTPDCPGCGAWITKVILTKFDDECENVVRRRHCEYCGHRFYTRQHHEEMVEVKWVNGKKGKATIPRVTKVLPTLFKGQMTEPLPVKIKKEAA
jgi:hypothetical protein